MFFSLTPKNFKVFQVFKGIDERNSPNWVLGLGMEGLLKPVVINFVRDKGRGLTCTCSSHFHNRSSVLFVTCVKLSLFYFLCSHKKGIAAKGSTDLVSNI